MLSSIEVRPRVEIFAEILDSVCGHVLQHLHACPNPRVCITRVQQRWGLRVWAAEWQDCRGRIEVDLGDSGVFVLELENLGF